MNINLRNFDLNLLVCFDALMSERNVSKAAEKVFLSQSGMSHALNRLRTLLDDPILMRTEQGMMPTPRALEIEVPIREMLNRINRTLYTQKSFDPLTSGKTFVVYSPEYFECLILPKLMAHLEKVAPHCSIKAEILTHEIPESKLTNGDVDFIIGVESLMDIPKNLRSRSLIRDSLVCIVREKNKKIGPSMSMEQFTETPHILFSVMGTPFKMAFLDKWLENQNIRRKFSVTSAAFLPAALILAETDYIMTLPRRIATKLTEIMALRLVELPINPPNFQLNLIWHPLYEKDPAHIWFKWQLLSL
ncbi:MAG: LysR family transcriptional regulator [Deltaproteobacteria bacterium]|nr:LysR family transcriptional regulator [Deltaproteobacteria bacterium]